KADAGGHDGCARFECGRELRVYPCLWVSSRSLCGDRCTADIPACRGVPNSVVGISSLGLASSGCSRRWKNKSIRLRFGDMSLTDVSLASAVPNVTWTHRALPSILDAIPVSC